MYKKFVKIAVAACHAAALAAAVLVTAALALMIFNVQNFQLTAEERIFDAECMAVGEDSPYLIKGIEPFGSRQIILSMGESSGTIYISWKGDKTEPSFFRFAEDAAELPSARIREANRKKILYGEYYRYSVKLTGLIPGRSYFFEIGDGVVFDSPESFEAPKARGDTQLLYLGDVQCGDSIEGYRRWENMTKEALRENPKLDFAVAGGDMINIPVSENQWNGFLDSCDIFSSLPLMTVPGNHEGVHSNKTYSKIFSKPDNGPDWEGCESKDDTAAEPAFYWFDYGVCRFVMLDSSFFTKERRETAGEEQWLKQEKETEKWLKFVLKSSKAEWNIAVMHHPPYGVYEKEEVSEMMRGMWVPIMEKYGTDLVLCGHQHMYMRTCRINGIVYVMGNSGNRDSRLYKEIGRPFYIRKVYEEGSNYQIVRASRRELKISSYNEKGLIIDETSVGKKSWLHIFKFFGSN